jgi:hypothetical protein
LADLGGLLPTTLELELELPDTEIINSESETVTLPKRRFQIFIGASVLLGGLLAFTLLFLSGSVRGILPTSEAKNAIAGEVALTEQQLIQLVNEAQVNAYWVGPLAGASYALTITADNQVFVKYLPDGNGLDDLKPEYRVIATYPEAAAYDITRAAGTQSTAISFINSDGAAVFYSKDRPTNVYVAYAGIPFEIEVFDPDAATALDFATTPGSVSKIK